MNVHYDIAIIGGGPAGLTAAIKLKHTGLKVALFEKSNYPKPVTCGDGLTEDIMRQLPMISDTLLPAFEALEEKNEISNIGVHYRQDIRLNLDLTKVVGGYRLHTCPRARFDQLLYQEAVKDSTVTFHLNTKITNLTFEKEQVHIATNSAQFTAGLVLAADGHHSIALRALPELKDKLRHKILNYPSVQAYFSKVQGLKQNEVKIFFTRQSSPLYFWIFPLADGRFNVGMSALKAILKKNHTDLRTLFAETIRQHPEIAPYFEQAQQLTQTNGRPIACSVQHHAMSCNRVMLLGDAGGCSDFLTGEGVGNALRSGRLAAETAVACFKHQRFDSSFLKRYDTTYKKYTQHEILKSKLAAFMLSHPMIAKPLLSFYKRKKGSYKTF